MNKTTQLKKLLLQRKALPCPGVYDALSGWWNTADFKHVRFPGLEFRHLRWG